ncbi:hypothetical protein K3495_g1925 [Podosphaera aphanis]|nr:hypothetical protein K3495_g1925 [Podosphaera aphanis]
MPVPSEGALRILRHLALGTSCTAVFTLGLILEDRQRLIYTAQILHSNSEKLKSSKRYTTAGASVIKALEDRILNNHDYESKPAEGLHIRPLPIIKEQRKNLTAKEGRTTSRKRLRNSMTSIPSHLQSSPSSLHISRVTLDRNGRGNYEWLIPGTVQGLRQLSSITKFEQCISSCLDETPPQIDRAMSHFMHSFPEIVDHDRNILGLTEVKLLGLALTLFRVCKSNLRLDDSQKVFQLVLKWGIEKNVFFSFQLENIVRKLLSQQTPTSFEKAVFIYLATVRSRKTVTPRLLSLGYELCDRTFKVKQFQFTRDIFHHIKKFNDKFPYKTLGCILVSLSKQETYQPEVTEYFAKYSMQTKLVKEQYNSVVTEIVDHLLVHGKFDDAEKVVRMASYVAEQQKIVTSVVPCAHLLQNNWDTFRDLDRILALFKRVESYIHRVRFPWVLYELMIKICLEAEETTHAWSFHKTVSEKYGQRTGVLLSQLTLLKAKKGNREGVLNDFKMMNQEHVNEYSRLFPKILKEYSNNNSFSDTEILLENAFKAGINLSIDTINKIAERYARDRDIEALSCLVQYATRKGHVLDSTFVNMILKQAYTHWKYKIEDVLDILESLIKLNPAGQIVNINTFFLLRSIIVSHKRRSEAWKFGILRRLDEIFKPCNLEQRDPYNPKQVLWEMVVSLNADDPKETLAIYNWACSNNVIIEPEHLNVAVEAKFRCSDGNTNDALKMIHSSGLSGSQTATSISLLFIHQLQQLVHQGKHTADEVVRLTMEFITAFEKRGLKVPVKVVTQTISTLERLHYYLAVIDFWEFVSPRLSLTTSVLEISTLTVFLKTCIGLRDIPGFWHVFNIMENNKIIPDQHFSLVLENARRSFLRALTTRKMMPKKENIQFLDTLIQGRTLVTKIRAAAFTQRNTSVPRLIEKMGENFKALSPTR